MYSWGGVKDLKIQVDTHVNRDADLEDRRVDTVQKAKVGQLGRAALVYIHQPASSRQLAGGCCTSLGAQLGAVG